jgi:predicted dehydrogenase
MLGDLFQLAALAEPSERVRDGLSHRYGIARTFATHEEMLERAQLDAVLICSPNATHARAALNAIDAGLHVLVEKPLCLTHDDARAIGDGAKRAGVVVQVGYMKRFDPAYEALLDRLPPSAELKLVTTTTVDPGIGERPRPAGFIAPADVNGSASRALQQATAEQVAVAVGSDDPRHVKPFSDAFLGALVHDVNLVLGVLDRIGLRIDEVTDAAGASDGSLAYAACRLGDYARWTAAWMLLPRAESFCEELRLFTGDGALSLRFPAPYDAHAPTQLQLDGEPARSLRPPADSYARELEHFHACVTSGEACRTPAEQGARDVDLLTELYRAAVAA